MATAANPNTRSTITEAVLASLTLDGMRSTKAFEWGRRSYLRIAAELRRARISRIQAQRPNYCNTRTFERLPSPPYRPPRTRQATSLARGLRPFWCGASTTRTLSRRKPPRLSGQGHAPPPVPGYQNPTPPWRPICLGRQRSIMPRPLRPEKQLSFAFDHPCGGDFLRSALRRFGRVSQLRV